MGETRIAVAGCGGRMGRMLLAEIAATPGARIAGGFDREESGIIGKDLGELAGTDWIGVPAISDPGAAFAAVDVVVDFTAPAASVAHAGLAASSGKALVIGTTGLDAAQARAVEASASRAAIVWAPNMSLGINLLLGLVEETARRLGTDWDIEVLEMHHHHKVDAPSGTALALGRAAAKGRNVDLDAVAQRVRDGHTGARRPGDIGFATLRGGDVVGDHTVIFAAAGERIELGHRAGSRQLFARGAVGAALWAAGRKPGLYGMKDVLGF